MIDAPICKPHNIARRLDAPFLLERGFAMAARGAETGSMLLVDEFFSSGDQRFLGELYKVNNPKTLAPLADRWQRDHRPWARQQIFIYLDSPLTIPGHQPLVKRLFKAAERESDDKLMAAFMVAFDRLVRLIRRKRWHYDWQTRQSWQEERLYAPRNSLPAEVTYYTARNPRTGEKMQVPMNVPRNGRLFKHRTRYYLRRRAWRYFRRMGFQRPAGYCAAVASALAAYRDEDLNQGEHVLESWGLVQACFRKHDALQFGATHIRIKPGRSLVELRPAPRFLPLWQKADALPILVSLLADAKSRLVRHWAIGMLREHQREFLPNIQVEDILRLLDHADDEARQFGAELLEQSPQLGSLPIALWLKLLATDNPTTLATICAAMQRHVSPERLSLAHCVELACAKATPVARLGFTFLKSFPNRTAEDRAAIAGLAAAQSSAMGKEIAQWALGIVGTREHYDVSVASAFFDSLVQEVRAGAWEWLQNENSPGHHDAALFARLLETPFDDIRLRLIDALRERASLPVRDADDLAPIWSSVLLGVQRGGRQKTRAVEQLAAAIGDKPHRANSLLPVMAVAVRSVRGPELRAGLSAVATVVERRPELLAAVRRHLPELEFVEEFA
jgi:hypothetical protein